nr:hypothetical protein [Sphingomonas sp. CL5.1]
MKRAIDHGADDELFAIGDAVAFARVGEIVGDGLVAQAEFARDGEVLEAASREQGAFELPRAEDRRRRDRPKLARGDLARCLEPEQADKLSDEEIAFEAVRVELSDSASTK